MKVSGRWCMGARYACWHGRRMFAHQNTSASAWLRCLAPLPACPCIGRHARMHAPPWHLLDVARRACTPPAGPAASRTRAEENEGGENLQTEEWLAKVAALGRASAALSLPLLADRLAGCLGALQQAMQSGAAWATSLDQGRSYN